jgi:hypothetical protein
MDLVALAAVHPICPDCQCARSSPALRMSEISLRSSSILVDTSSGVFRPLIPATFRCPIFDTINSLAHPGIRASRRLISSLFVWPDLASQVGAWCRDFQQCQQGKVTSQLLLPPGLIANPAQRFSHLHIDLVPFQ